MKELVSRGVQGRTTVGALLGMGVAWAEEAVPLEDGQEVSLMTYPWEDNERMVVLFPNFRVILRYNRSINYALVVADLAEALVVEAR